MAAAVKVTNSDPTKEEAIRKQLAAFREARKQKLMMRLSRNNPNPSKIASLEAIAGIQCSKKLEEQDKTKSAPVNKAESTKMENKPSAKRNLSFRQTATSIKRATMTSGNFKLPPKEIPPTKSIVSDKKPVVPQIKHIKTNPRLTVPQSPSFTRRPPKLVTDSLEKLPTKPAAPVKSEKKQDPKKVEIKTSANRKSSSWMVPLTPEKSVTAVDGAKNSPRTPKIKPFARKSFTDSKMPRKSVLPMNRTFIPSIPKPLSDTRRSMSVSTISTSSRSSWMIQKEPSEKEKIQQWLEKRGRSIASCRHLGCLGHKLEDFNVPERRSSSRKSIKIIRAAVEEAFAGSPQLKRQSVLNTTFEKEDEETLKEEVKPLNFEQATDLVIEEAASTQCNDQLKEATDASEYSNGEEAFQTPPTVAPEVPAGDKVDDTVDFSSVSEGNVEKLLEAILGLFQQPIYPETKIESWLQKSETVFPAVKSHAFYWEIKARLAHRRGDTEAALDIYSQALKNNVEPVDLVGQFFENFLQRMGSQLPSGQRTPFAKSLGLKTPRADHFTPRKLEKLDSSQIFPSSVVKYELKLKRIFRNMEKDMKENGTPMRKVRSEALKTPLRLEAASNLLTMKDEESAEYKLVATPVRRSMRPKSMHFLSKVQESVLYVDDLNQLSPKTRSKLELRSNAALPKCE